MIGEIKPRAIASQLSYFCIGLGVIMAVVIIVINGQKGLLPGIFLH